MYHFQYKKKNQNLQIQIQKQMPKQDYPIKKVLKKSL
jgi:hypothetical protein